MKSKIIFFLLLGLFIYAKGYSNEKPSFDLSIYEKKIYSQNGEDGVLLKLFDLIGTTNKYFVEFGVENGFECNTRFIREYLGWYGLMMDGRYSNPLLNLHQEFITAENINDLFEKYHVPEEFDLLSIDLDYNDFYIWLSLNEKFRPRVVVIEYNGSHPWYEDKVAVYHPLAVWDLTNYYGASLAALDQLGKFKGYTLVYAENNGVNLFFVRDDIYQDLPFSFKNAADLQKIYRRPRYGHGPNGGHMQDPLYRAFTTAEAILKNFLTKTRQ